MMRLTKQIKLFLFGQHDLHKGNCLSRSEFVLVKSPVCVSRSKSSKATLCLWVTLAVCIGLIIQFGLFSKPPLSWLLSGLSRADLVWHTLAFASLALPSFLLFRPMAKVAFSLFLLGGILELAQLTTVTRQASFSDLLADGVGIALAAGCFLFLKRMDLSALRLELAKSS